MQKVSFRFGGPLTQTIKNLMIINVAVFLVQQLAGFFYPGAVEQVFGLNFAGFFYEFKLWQIFTYMFLHGNLLHLLFNMLAIWMFAGELEQLWGKKTFLQYYIFSGIGAGLFISLMNYYVFTKYGYMPVTIGASGAIYGILLAYGITWPNREVLLYFVFPVKIKYMMIGFGLIEFLGTLAGSMGAGGNISHIGHLGGIISGFAFIMLRTKSGARAGQATAKRGHIKEFLRKRRLRNKQEQIEKRIKAKKIIDELLEKIARSGMESLSAADKRNLEWARKNYYPNEDDIVH